MSQTNTNTNLDLSTVATDDLDKIASSIETFYKNDSSVKSQLSWNWERNQLMLDGKQWIIFEGNQATGGMWKPLRTSKQNEYIPRPVTNYLLSDYQTLKSYLLKNRPRSEVFPNTGQWRDIKAAKLGTLCLQCNWARLKEDQNYEYAASAGVTYGTVFKKDFWDTTTVNLVKIPRMIVRPQTDPNTGMPILDQSGQPVMQEVQEVNPETGDLEYDILPLGDVNTDIIEPYRMIIDPLAMDLHKARWIMEYSIQPLPQVKDTYGKDPALNPGYTGRVDELQEETSLSNSMRRFFQLKTSAGTRSNLNNAVETAATGDYMFNNVVVVKEYWEKPSQSYPNGRLFTVANGVPLYAGDSPCSGDEQDDWHPYSEFRWEKVPGRFWGKSPLDEAVEINKQINSIDSLIALTRKTTAVPQKLIPMGIGLTPGMFTGRPGQEIFYKDTGTGSKPETVPGIGLDPQVLQERAQKRADMQEITGAVDILKGGTPPGVEAASAMNMLFEVATGKLAPMLERWRMFVENSQKKQLKLIARYYKEPREDYIKMLKAKNSELSDEDINNFIGTDLYDNMNVVVEAGSNIPKLQAAQQARLMEVAQTGALQLQIPANRLQFLSDLGIKGYDTDVGPDRRRAEWENAKLDNVANNPSDQPIVMDADNHDIHIKCHQDRQKEPSYFNLPPEAQQAYDQHIMQHEQFKQMAMQAQMLQQQAMGPSPGAPIAAPKGEASQPSGKLLELDPAGKGLSKDMKQQVFGKDLKPGAI